MTDTTISLAPKRDLRGLRNMLFTIACYTAAAIGVGAFAWVFLTIVGKGASSLDLNFFTETPKPVGETGGGMANAIVGSLIVVGLATAISVPIGVGAGTYLAEFGRGRLATIVRMMSDVLTGVPSIVVGLLAYQMVVLRMHKYSAFAGGVALAALMLPGVIRTTEEMIRLVPSEYRDGALALGSPRWRATLTIVYPAAIGGLLTGILLSIARAMGETAPLLLTILGNEFWSTNMTGPMAALPLQIYKFTISPYEEQHRLAWAGAFVLVTIVFVISLLARIVVSRKRY